MNNNLIYLNFCILIFFAYVFSALLGLGIQTLNGFVTLIWPPSGIALAVFFIFGFRFWPGIFLGAFVTNIILSKGLLIALPIAIGNTLAFFVGAYILKFYTQFNPKFERVRDVFLFIVFGGLLGAGISATNGATTLWLFDIIASSEYISTWLAWFIGDGLGVIIFGSFLVIWLIHRQIIWSSLVKLKAESVFLIATILLVMVFLFTDLITSTLWLIPSSAHLLFIPTLWAALRFGSLGAISSVFILTSMVIWGTLYGKGPFAGEDVFLNLLYLQTFMGSVSIISMIIGARTEERDAQTQNKRISQDNSSEGCYLEVLGDGAIISFSREFEEMTGWSSSDWRGKSFFAIFHEEDAPRYMTYFSEIKKKSSQFDNIGKVRIKNKYGKYIEAEIKIRPIFKNERITRATISLTKIS